MNRFWQVCFSSRCAFGIVPPILRYSNLKKNKSSKGLNHFHSITPLFVGRSIKISISFGGRTEHKKRPEIRCKWIVNRLSCRRENYSLRIFFFRQRHIISQHFQFVCMVINFAKMQRKKRARSNLLWWKSKWIGEREEKMYTMSATQQLQ